ncbi:NADP-dependent oxidoreductase [Dyella flagellata]|nr:NADP-dependent oxidoreductase [Dyella flagellata]
MKSRPHGVPIADNFFMAEVKIPAPAQGEVLVRNLWMSVDPYMRGRMNEGASYIPPFELGHPLVGAAIGQVVASRASGFREGDYVTSMLGWREAFTAKAGAVTPLINFVHAMDVPLEMFLGPLGVPGLTSYVSLFRIGKLLPGERVFISGASGAVGSFAAIVAKSMGCYVVGTAGDETKRAWLQSELGLDVALNYRATDFEQSLKNAFPEGIDLYLDNVGGEQLRMALDLMRDFGRIIASGMIDQYNDVAPRPGPANLYNIVTRRLRYEGFIVMDHFDLTETFQRTAAELYRSGKLKWVHTAHEGIASAPQALIDLNSGKASGKSVIRLGSSK